MTALEGKALLDHGTTIARRYAHRVGREMADELRAEAVARALGSPPPDGRIEPWLERIYRNLVVDLWRRKHVTVDISEFAHLAVPGSPEEHALEHERRRAVRAVLASLPREARRALLYRFYGGLDDQVAASRFGTSPTTVRTRIHRALVRLRTQLATLRAYFPPLLGRLGAQFAAVGAAPLMVAALLGGTVAGGNSPSVAARVTQPVVNQRYAEVIATPTAEAEVLAPPPARAAAGRSGGKPSRRLSAPVAPEQPPPLVAVAAATSVVGEILEPDGSVVFAEPEQPVLPCLVEVPPHFLAQIDAMIEEQL